MKFFKFYKHFFELQTQINLGFSWILNNFKHEKLTLSYILLIRRGTIGNIVGLNAPTSLRSSLMSPWKKPTLFYTIHIEKLLIKLKLGINFVPSTMHVSDGWHNSLKNVSKRQIRNVHIIFAEFQKVLFTKQTVLVFWQKNFYV